MQRPVGLSSVGPTSKSDLIALIGTMQPLPSGTEPTERFLRSARIVAVSNATPGKRRTRGGAFCRGTSNRYILVVRFYHALMWPVSEPVSNNRFILKKN